MKTLTRPGTALLLAMVAVLAACGTSNITQLERYALARQTFNATVSSILTSIETGLYDPDESTRATLLSLIERGSALLDLWGTAVREDRSFPQVPDLLAILRTLIFYEESIPRGP